VDRRLLSVAIAAAQLRHPPVQRLSLHRNDIVVHGGANQWVDEGEPGTGDEDAGGGQRTGNRPHGLLLATVERSDLDRGGAIPSDGDGVGDRFPPAT
jgi:hypothetical protein